MTFPSLADSLAGSQFLKGKKMAGIKDLAGQRFGRLVVLYDTGERKCGRVVWHCRCDCGNEVDVVSSYLVSGNTRSCGCYQRERTAETHTTHGMSQRGKGKYHPVYEAWHNMLQRCENPNHKWYKDYGGRGITVCDEWHDPQIFISWALASGWEKGLALDRIDNNGNYKPDNCRLVTPKENSRNKRSNRLITFDDKTQTMAEWAEELNISYDALKHRINKLHWPIERALTEPIRGHKHAS